ncbi:MAG TPA: response regulator [Thermoanaerobaculia bacterium]|jgi:DNA-binding response OmpR family regulator|nr:response regulator [Thermoanaerobaculia bacterium]
MVSSRATPKILIFEDIDSDYRDLRKAVVDSGFHPVRATNAEEFRAHSPWSDFALIIMDLFLGEGPGAEKLGIALTQAVHAQNPNVPIIVASSRGPERDAVADSFRAGAKDYVDKAVLLQDVGGTLKRLLSEAARSYEERGEEEFPLPIAFLVRDFRRSKTEPRRRVERMVELFEVTLKIITFALISAHRESITRLVPLSLRVAFARPSLGHLSKMIDALPEPANFLQKLGNAAHNARFRDLCASLTSVRNEYVGHGVMQSDAVYEKVLVAHEPEIMELLKLAEPLRDLRLIWIGSAQSVFEDGSHEYQAKVFRGSNPEAVSEQILMPRGVRAPTVLLAQWPASEVVDVHPWCQYTVCEQRCLNTKLFMYRLARYGELWLLDHTYGHALQTRKGWTEFQQIIGTAAEE